MGGTLESTGSSRRAHGVIVLIDMYEIRLKGIIKHKIHTGQTRPV